MSAASHAIKLFYVVNARIPNVRAHGIQIVNTCESLGGHAVDLTLVTPDFVGEHTSLSAHYGVTQAFTHRKIFALDIPGIRLRYVLRNVSFFISVNVYIVASILATLFTRKKIVVYARGEVVLALIPLSFFIPLFFETHQIRNYERWYKIALTRARGIVVVTDALKKKFVDEYHLSSEKILVARDSVDLTKFTTMKNDEGIWSRYGIPKDKKIVLYAGTLSVEKGVYTLAEAAPHVGPSVQLVFLGGTDEQIASFKEKYGHVENISILGRVAYTEVPTFVSAAQVLVLPDLAEYTFSNLYTSPMKLFEYMASGKPIVAASVPSLQEVLDTDSALFFDSGDSQSLAARIQEVTANPGQFEGLAKRAKERVAEFTWEKRASAIWAHILRYTKVTEF